MLFSIIIPIFNDEKFLAECLDSCLDQALSTDEFEIICIDDGSTDRTPEILRDYASRRPNIRVITKQHGTEYGRGRDMGLAVAQGDFVWFVDHDDVVAPNALLDIKAAAESDESADRIAFPYYEFFEELTPLEKQLMRDGKLIPNGPEIRSSYVLWSGVFRASFLKAHNIQPHSQRVVAAGRFWGIDDFTVWGGDYACMEECFDNGMRTKQLNGRPLYHYRRSTVSQSMSLSKDARNRREQLKLYSSLLRGYLACDLKAQYLAEREANGKASRDTTVNMILKVRKCISEMAILSGGKWREGMKLLREKGLFFSHRPPEYDFSFRDYLKTRTLKEKISPSTYANYFAYSLAGARCFRFFMSFTRLKAISPTMIKRYREHKRKRIVKLGTGAVSAED